MYDLLQSKMKLYIAVIVFILCWANSSAQYYTGSQVNTIRVGKTAAEGDLYLDTLGGNFYIGLTTGGLAIIGDTLDEKIDSVFVLNDSLTIIEGNDTLFISIDSIGDHDWYKYGTTKSAKNIADTIYTDGEVILGQHPNTRGDDTTAHLNVLYTNANGVISSARREVTPPTAYISAKISNTGNTFNYYNHYSVQLTNIGLTPIPLSKLDFYIYSYDTLVF